MLLPYEKEREKEIVKYRGGGSVKMERYCKWIIAYLCRLKKCLNDFIKIKH